jgi:hypothetical protein
MDYNIMVITVIFYHIIWIISMKIPQRPICGPKISPGTSISAEPKTRPRESRSPPRKFHEELVELMGKTWKNHQEKYGSFMLDGSPLGGLNLVISRVNRLGVAITGETLVVVGDCH